MPATSNRPGETCAAAPSLARKFPAAPAEEAHAREASQPTPPLRVLIVEDEAVTALNLESTLLKLGHDVVDIVDTAPEAVAAAAAHRPDLVFMDIRLAGGSDGVDAALQIRNSCDIPSVFLTAHSDARTRSRAAAARPLDFLVKPFSPDKIAGALRRAADRCGFDQA